MKKTPTLLVAIALSLTLSAQQSDELVAYPVPEIYSSPDELTTQIPMQTIAIGEAGEEKIAPAGTYQVIRKLNAPEDMIGDHLLQLIETLRHEMDEVLWEITDNTRIRILPASEIRKPDFLPVKEPIVYMEF